MSIGTHIRQARKGQRLSQEALARQAGISLNVLNRIERGVITDPHYSTLSGIANALGTSVSELLEEGAGRTDVQIRREGSHISVEVVDSVSVTDETRHTLASKVNERFDAIVADLHAERVGDDVIREAQSMRSRLLELVAGR